MKKQKHRTLKDELNRSLGAQYAMGDQWRNNPKKSERWKQSGGKKKPKHTQLWMRLVMEVKSGAVKSNIP